MYDDDMDDEDGDDQALQAGDGTNELGSDVTAIQELLDLGYDQLDGFVQWEEDSLKIGTRVAQQDAFNAELLIDYLANNALKGVSGIDEFDLRWFMFSHYIRKAQADPETEERLPDSLERFFHYLHTVHAELVPAWLPAVLDDRSYFHQRRRDFHDLDQMDEQEWEDRFQRWCEQLEDDLDLRCLWLPRDMGDGLQWSRVMGWREATLQAEANREWQQDRARLLREGYDYDGMRDQLEMSYRIWLDTPQQRLEDRSPREVILQERADRSATDEELP